MKKIILTSAIIFATVAGVFAQGATSTDQVTLNVILTPFQTINVTGQKTVNLRYNAAHKYKEGVTEAFEDHLKVQSTGGFSVKVSSHDIKLTNDGSDETIKSTGISIEASNGGAALAKSQFSKVNLTSEAKTLISSKIGSLEATYNVKYTGEKDNGYLNKLVAANKLYKETTYTTTVTYSLEAL